MVAKDKNCNFAKNVSLFITFSAKKCRFYNIFYKKYVDNFFLSQNQIVAKRL